MNKFTAYFRIFLSVVCLCIIIVNPNLKSAPVDSSKAKTVASNFYNYGILEKGAPMESPKLAFVGALAQKSGMPCYYIFNFENGFVIVSAEDKLDPIVAFSDESSFDVKRFPANMYSLLDDYARAVGIKSADTACPSKTKEWEKYLVASGSLKMTNDMTPMITTKWDQGTYYNNCCPLDSAGENGHAYVGCVSTAMGQIIRYWEFPSSGIGSHSYEANNSDYGYGDYGTLSVDFANTQYRYDLMIRQLKSSTSADRVEAVATLLYHCGVSLDARYGGNSTAAFTTSVPNALHEFFGYPECHYEKRDDYSDSAWFEMLKGEIDLARPVYCNGHSDGSEGGGHAFILDAYNSEDLFHINWGWSGNGNGYFNLMDIVVYDRNFNATQGAIFGWHAPEVSVNDLPADKNIRCYPNPTSHSIVVSVDELEIQSDVVAIVYDLCGRQLLEKVISGTDGVLDLHDQPEGIYMLRVFADGKMLSSQKIVKAGR